MCFSSLFLSTKYQKIDDLFIRNEFSSIFCEQTNSSLNESRGLSRGLMFQKKITQNDYKIVTIFN